MQQDITCKSKTHIGFQRWASSSPAPGSARVTRGPTPTVPRPTQSQSRRRPTEFSDVERQLVMTHRQELMSASQKIATDKKSSTTKDKCGQSKDYPLISQRTVPSIPSSRGFVPTEDLLRNTSLDSLSNSGNKSFRLRLTNYHNGDISPSEDRYLTERLKSPTFKLLEKARDAVCFTEIENSRVSNVDRIESFGISNFRSSKFSGSTTTGTAAANKRTETQIPQTNKFNASTVDRDGYISRTITSGSTARTVSGQSYAQAHIVDKETIKSELEATVQQHTEVEDSPTDEEESPPAKEPEGPSSVVCMLEDNKTKIFITLPRF